MTESSDGIPPRVFFSYSWSNKSHEQWVLNLAAELRGAGVDVVLDKWDLKEGQDKFAFMERMVNDPTVAKVVVVSDRAYAEKANRRQGGVGTETQVISRKLYENVEETKFVPVIAEVLENGEAALPAFMASRKYIDMSTPELQTRNFDTLVRVLHDKPEYPKPPLGSPPRYITEPSLPGSSTALMARRLEDAVRQGVPNVESRLEDYVAAYAEGLAAFRLNKQPEEPLDEAVVRSLEALLPLRDEIVDVLLAFFRHVNSDAVYMTVQRLFELVSVYRHPPDDATPGSRGTEDHFSSFVHELVVYVVAALLKTRRYERAREFLDARFFVRGASIHAQRAEMEGYRVFWSYPDAFDQRKKRLGSNRVSLVADALRERSRRKDVTFEQIMEADFVLFLDGLVNALDLRHWRPMTLIFASHRHHPFEMFARVHSPESFRPLRTLFGVSSGSELVERYRRNAREGGYGNLFGSFQGFEPLALMNAEILKGLS